MLSTAERIHALITKDLCILSDNYYGAERHPDYVETFIKNDLSFYILKEFRTQIMPYFSAHSREQDPKYILWIYLSMAILTKALQAGNCGQRAAVSLLEYLKSSFITKLELATIWGIKKNKKKAEHLVVLAGRVETNWVENPQNWKKLVVSNSWAGTQPKEYKGDATPTMEDLTGNEFEKIERAELILTIHTNLSEQQYEDIWQLFKLLKNFITPQLIEYCLKMTIDKLQHELMAQGRKVPEIKPDEIHKKIQAIILKEQADFKKKKMVITHWDKPQTPIENLGFFKILRPQPPLAVTAQSLLDVTDICLNSPNPCLLKFVS